MPTVIDFTSVQPGTLHVMGSATMPAGYLFCDGSAVSRTTYARLFGIVGTAFGTGDGSTTFNIPDLRGRFLRGFDNGAGNDPDSAARIGLVAGTFTVSGGSTNSTSTITVSSTGNLTSGMTVTGTNIPVSSYVRAILTGTTFTLGNAANTANVNATGTTSSLTFTFSKSPNGAYVGSLQADQITQHTHSVGGQGVGTLAVGGVSGCVGGGNATPGGGNTGQAGGNETRPKNVYAAYMIKY